MNTKAHMITEIIADRKAHPEYAINTQRIQSLKADPYKIPSLEEVKEMQMLNDMEFSSMTDDKIFVWIDIVKTFPDFHEFIIHQSGSPEFPDFEMPLVIFSQLSHYLRLLMEERNTERVVTIFSYLEKIIENNPNLAWFPWEVLECTDSYPIEMRKEIYKMLPQWLKWIFDQYYSHYLI